MQAAHRQCGGRRQGELDAAVAATGPKATGIQADSANLSDLHRLYERLKTEASRTERARLSVSVSSSVTSTLIRRESCRTCLAKSLINEA